MLKKNIFIYLGIVFSFLFLNSCSDSSNITNPKLTTHELENSDFDSFPIWSPLGNQLIYAGGNEEEGWSLFTIDTNGTNKQKINSTIYFKADWSPDGKWIVYSYGGQIFKKNLSDTTITIKLTNQGNNFNPTWSKDGQWIAYDSNLDSPNGMYFVWKMKSDGSSKKQIIHTPNLGEVREPDWFPDGIRIAVIRFVPGQNGTPEISIIDTSGNSISYVTNDDKFDRNPKVSPDGSEIIYYRDDNEGQICIVKTDGSDFRKITNGNTIYPEWSPNGDMVAYTNIIDGKIWIMKKSGIIIKKISY